MISDDAGGTWREVAVPGSMGCVHMNIVAGRRLAAGAVPQPLGRLDLRVRSTDDGDTWSDPVPTELPNNNSSIQQRLLADGRLALVYNHASRLDATARRLSLYDEIDDDGLVEPITTAAPTAAPAVPEAAGSDEADDGVLGDSSRADDPGHLQDAGKTFEVAGNLDVGDGYCLSNNSRDGLNREYSYPSIHQGPDGRLDIAYTYFRQAIKHVRVPSGWSQGS